MFREKKDGPVPVLVYGKYKRFLYKAGDQYKEVSNPDDWLECPKCGLKPIVWMFDNGMFTACGCGECKYSHFSIVAESIMSYLSRVGNVIDYDGDRQLRNNWNAYCEGSEIIDNNWLKYYGLW